MGHVWHNIEFAMYEATFFLSFWYLVSSQVWSLIFCFPFSVSRGRVCLTINIYKSYVKFLVEPRGQLQNDIIHYIYKSKHTRLA